MEKRLATSKGNDRHVPTGFRCYGKTLRSYADFTFARLLLLLELRDLVHTPCVPAAFELRFQPDAYHALDQLFAQEVCGQAQDIGVVMAAAHLRGDAIVSGGRAHAVVLDGGVVHSDAGAADQDAACDPPLAHSLGLLICVFRVIEDLPG